MGLIVGEAWDDVVRDNGSVTVPTVAVGSG